MEVKVHSIETLGALDGPGLRTIFFLGGCPLRCKYCHNPDMFTDKSSTAKTVQELVALAKRYKLYYENGGGVTLSGGEPLVQAEGCYELITALKKEGIHTCLDTSGGIYSEKVLSAVDLVILDFKHTTPDEYLELTGIKMDNFVKTLNYIKANEIPFWARQVIVPGITDDENQVKAFVKMAEGSCKTEILPYHIMGKNKYKKLGLEYPLEGVEPLDAKTVKKLKALIK